MLAVIWEENPSASFRISVGTNVDGEIAGDEDEVAGLKAQSFGYVDNSATLEALIGGTDGDSDAVVHGLGGVFVEYLLGGEVSPTTARKTVTYKAQEVA